MRRELAVAAAITCGCVLVFLGAANSFPDAIWLLLTKAQAKYEGMISRLTPIPSGVDGNFQEYRIYESVIRSATLDDNVIFLRVNDSDPTDELIGRFKASGLVVKRASEANFRDGETVWRYWKDPASGRRAVEINVGSVRWLFGDRVEVSGGLSCGPHCGAGGIYRLVKRKGRWAVDDFRQEWIS